MSRMKDLALLLDEMIEAGNKMAETAAALKEYFSSPAEPEAPKKEATPPKQENAPESAPVPPALTKEDVRKLLVAKSNESEGAFKPQVKALVKKYSATGNLSAIPTEQYATLVKELEVVGNG